MLRPKYKYVLLGFLTLLISLSAVSPASASFGPILTPTTDSTNSNTTTSGTNSVGSGNLANTGSTGSTSSEKGSVGSGNLGGSTTPATTKNQSGSNNVIVTNYIDPMIKFLGIGFGLIIVIVVMIGGLQYMTAGPNPQAILAAKKRIANALLALIVFTFMFALLQWIVPGGIF